MEKGKDKIFFTAVAAFLGGILVFFFYDAFAPGSILFGHDTLNIYLPFKMFAREAAFTYHDLPFWMPHLFFGIPLIASSSLLYFYPTDLISILLPFDLRSFYTFDLMIHMLLAYSGMYLFLRQTGVRREASFFGGIVIMLAGFLVSYVNAGHWNNIKAGALIPFIFYFTERGIAQKKLVHFINASIFMALQILATGMQIMAYTYLCVLAYSGYRVLGARYGSGEKIRLCVYTALGAVFIALFSALQLVPSIPYTDYSWRGNFNYAMFTSWSMHPLESLSLLLPQFFGIKNSYYGFLKFNLTTYYFGLLPLLLAPFAFTGQKKRKSVFFFLIISFVLLLLSFGGYTPLYGLFYYIPVFNQFRNPARFMYLFTFFAAATAAIGLENILNVVEKPDNGGRVLKTWKICTAVSSLAAAGLLFIIPDANLYTLINRVYRGIQGTTVEPGLAGKIGEGIKQDVFVFLTVAAAFYAVTWLVIKKKFKHAMAAALIILAAHFMDMYRIDKQFVVYSDFSSYVPASDSISNYLKQDRDIFRMTDFGLAWGANRNIYYNIEGVSGMHGLMPEKYIKLANSGVFNIIAADEYMNIKYAVNKADVTIPQVEKVADQGIKLYRLNGVKSRFEMTDRIIKMNNDDEILNFMKSGQFDFSSVIVKDPIDMKPDASLLKYSVNVLKYTPNAIDLDVECGRDAMLVIKNMYYPDWKVKVDNKEKKFYNVDYAFMGLPLKIGRHKVTAYYSRNSFYAGLVMTFMGLLAYLAVLFSGMVKNKGDRAKK